MSIDVTVATVATPALVQGLNRLLPQLSSSATPLDEATLGGLLENPAVTLFAAYEGENLVGTLSLVFFPIPTGSRAWIEDVVVDDSARGKGVGAALTQAAVETARAKGAKTVDLTSRPSREAAQRLYTSLGFQQRDTNVYRFILEG